MVKEDIDGETGFGIGKQELGGIAFLVTVDCDKLTITHESWYKADETISFDCICKSKKNSSMEVKCSY